jgi:hypothetical protein
VSKRCIIRIKISKEDTRNGGNRDIDHEVKPPCLEREEITTEEDEAERSRTKEAKYSDEALREGKEAL